MSCTDARKHNAVFFCPAYQPYATLVSCADARFQNTGLERAGPVATDIDNLAAEYSLQKPEPAADGPGNNYAKYGTASSICVSLLLF